MYGIKQGKLLSQGLVQFHQEGSMEKIDVTKAFLPPVEDYQRYINRIWSSGQLTNQGKLLLEFENKIKHYLGVENFHFVGNGTLALQIALRSLDITEGEIITTPFSYVATTSAMLWERCTPVFVDIDPQTLCIDPDKIEVAITPKTKAIMAVHVFGNPCEVEKIEVLAKKHNLKVIYDAAHAFGVEYGDKSLLDYGDISVCSFHSTKLFHTIEGGGVIVKNREVSEKVELIKRFGHNGDEHYMLGINAKASEFQAAMGLCNLEHIDEIIRERKGIFELYQKYLPSKIQRPTIKKDAKYNYAYYPIICDTEEQLLSMVEGLNKENIFPRRYFYPSLNRLPYVKGDQICSISEDTSRRILCLPLYSGLKESTIIKICEIIKG